MPNGIEHVFVTIIDGYSNFSVIRFLSVFIMVCAYAPDGCCNYFISTRSLYGSYNYSLRSYCLKINSLKTVVPHTHKAFLRPGLVGVVFPVTCINIKEA